MSTRRSLQPSFSFVPSRDQRPFPRLILLVETSIVHPEARTGSDSISHHWPTRQPFTTHTRFTITTSQGDCRKPYRPPRRSVWPSLRAQQLVKLIAFPRSHRHTRELPTWGWGLISRPTARLRPRGRLFLRRQRPPSPDLASRPHNCIGISRQQHRRNLHLPAAVISSCSRQRQGSTHVLSRSLHAQVVPMAAPCLWMISSTRSW